MNKQEAKRAICGSVSALLYNHIDELGADYIYARENGESDKDVDRLKEAAIDLADELHRRGQYRPVGLTETQRCDEIIAEWRGMRLVEHSGIPGRMVWRDKNDRLLFQESVWSPSTDITLWHNDGLLAEIERKDIVVDFVGALGEILCSDVMSILSFATFRFITATPSQLTDALVATIEEVSDG